MTTNKTPFQLVMEQVLEHGQQAESIGFKVLAAMIDMEVTFHKEWLIDYHVHKNTHGYQATKIREVLTELLGETYTQIVEDSQVKIKGADKADPDLMIKKQNALRKRHSLDTQVRNRIKALAFFIINPLNTNGLKVNNLNKTCGFVTEAGIKYEKLTMSDLEAMGERVAAEQGWIPTVKKEQKEKTAIIAENGKAKIEPSLARTEENNQKLFEASVTGMRDLINKTEFATMSDEGLKAVIALARDALIKVYGNTKGQIDLDDLADDYKGVFITTSKREAA